jgi:hypothetical protein
MGFLEDDIMTLRSYPLQKTQNFECILPDIGANDPTLVSRLVQTVNYNDYVMSDVNSMMYGPNQAFFAGSMKIEEFSITFLETENQDVKTYINAWRGLIIDNQGRFQVKLGYNAGYARTVTMNYMDNVGNTTNLLLLSNSFPLGNNALELDYTKSGVQRITVRFRTDGLIPGSSQS